MQLVHRLLAPLYGVRYGYPPCCILHWTLLEWLGVRGQARKRGVIRTRRSNLYRRISGGRLEPVKSWVPCYWHMVQHSKWKPYDHPSLRSSHATTGTHATCSACRSPGVRDVRLVATDPISNHLQ